MFIIFFLRYVIDVQSSLSVFRVMGFYNTFLINNEQSVSQNSLKVLFENNSHGQSYLSNIFTTQWSSAQAYMAKILIGTG